MKKSSILIASLFIGGLFAFISCTKTGPQGPAGQNGATGATGAQGPAGPVLYGAITGNVIMTNIYGVAVTTDYTAGYIKLVNSTTNAKVDSVIASSSGVYAIDSIPSGTYNMECVYPGYGISQTLNIVMTGGTRPYDNKLSAIPGFNVTTATDSIGTTNRDKGDLYISGSIVADGNGDRTVLVFVGTSSSVSSTPPNYSFIATTNVLQDSTSYTVTIPLTTIYNNGFAYGSNIYFAVYGASNNYTYGDYTNYTYGQLVYTAISTTDVIASPSLVLP